MVNDYNTLDLNKLPSSLKEAVEYELNNFEGVKLLNIKVMEGLTPYKDKTVLETLYMAAMEWGNLCISITFRTCSDKNIKHEIQKSSMIYGEILNIVNNNDFLKKEICK